MKLLGIGLILLGLVFIIGLPMILILAGATILWFVIVRKYL